MKSKENAIRTNDSWKKAGKFDFFVDSPEVAVGIIGLLALIVLAYTWRKI